jgi:uncharacterized protein (TIGR02246 family)
MISVPGSFLLLILVLGAAGPSSQSKADEEALRQLPRSFASGWAKHDAHEIARVMAEDVDFVTVGATWLHGRNDFETYHTKVLTGRFKDSTFTPLEMAVRFLRPDLAAVHFNWTIQGDRDPDGKARPQRYGMMVMVAERRSGKWLVLLAQNTNYMPGAPPELAGIKTHLPRPDVNEKR